MKILQRVILATVMACGLAGGAQAQQGEATIRKNLSERIPQMGKIDEITRSPMQGIWEVRVGSDIFYTDAQGNFILHGQLIDTKARRNLTEERIEKLSAVSFDSLPLKDAFTIVRGKGERKMAVFQDPNCGFCKRFERDTQKLDNVTIYMFLYPILGNDSVEKSRNIWCAKDKGKAWTDWMVRDQAPAEATCDSSALTRNVEFGRRARINGTPTTIFADGKRVPGAVPIAQVEKLLSEAK